MAGRIHVGIGGWAVEPWRSETPEGFVFSMQAARYARQRRMLAEAGESVQRFVASGMAELVVCRPDGRLRLPARDAYPARLAHRRAGGCAGRDGCPAFACAVAGWQLAPSSRVCTHAALAARP
jgi:hypothetical protein